MRRKKVQVREKVGKSRFIVFISIMICGSEGSKSRLAKAARAEPAGMRDEKLNVLAARSNLPSQTDGAGHFGS